MEAPVAHSMKSKYKIENHLNEKINKWTILAFSHIDKKGQQYWLCRCECGLEKSVRTSHLIRQLNKGCSYCKKQSYRSTNSPYWKGGKFISKSVLTSCLFSANKRNIDFKITIDDLENQWIKQNGKCAYTDIQLTLPINNADKSFNASVDRIDSSEPYIKENIQWVLKEVNIMKMDLPESKFLELCKRISARF